MNLSHPYGTKILPSKNSDKTLRRLKKKARYQLAKFIYFNEESIILEFWRLRHISIRYVA